MGQSHELVSDYQTPGTIAYALQNPHERRRLLRQAIGHAEFLFDGMPADDREENEQLIQEAQRELSHQEA